MLWGLEMVKDPNTREPASIPTLKICRALLERGFLVLPSGVYGNVLSLTPPVTITEGQLEAFFDALDAVLKTI